MNESTVRYHCKGIRNYTRTATSYFKTPEKEEESRLQAVRLLKWSPPKSNSIIIMDDESYFPLFNFSHPNNRFYKSVDKSGCPDKIKTFPRAKFPEKMMVRMAVSEDGVSEPFCMPSGGAVNADRYINILETKLLPWLKTFKYKKEVVLWCDKASSHYSKKVLNFLASKSILVPGKEQNPTNLPSRRVIEEIWGTIKRQVYQGGFVAKNKFELQRMIMEVWEEMEFTSF